MTPLLFASGVSKTFANGTHALGALDLAVNAGEFVSLLGPSGCGKSTALRLIADLLKPDAGSIHWQGGRPEISFVFQEHTLMPWASALDNVRLPLDLKGKSRSEGEALAKQALKRVGLQGVEKAYPRELSGGMKMRVSIARALAAGPKVLLMDEPFAALDELTRQSLNDELLKLWREDELTVIFVTHSVFESTYLSSRVLVMTPMPGRIHADIALPSPVGRTVDYRITLQFVEHAGKVSAALHHATKGVACDRP
jgi:NitT/TauT family transport system ATP-binding protein